MQRVDCIIVTYKPDILLLQNVLNSIISQVRNCYIINNDIAAFSFDLKNVTIIDLGKNYGIAYAQNRGIDLAKQHNADFVIFSDQDTIYPIDFISKMMTVYEKHHDKNKIGAIVPRFFDKNKMREMKLAIKKFKYITPDKDKIYCVSHAISSGTIIPVKNMESIGNMSEQLFIDWVDLEWCWRAIKLGYCIISVPGVFIDHAMGDGVIKIGNKKITIRNRIRYYYMIRNGIYIIRYTGILTLFEKTLFFIELFIKAMGMCFIEKRVLRLLFKAFYDGITNRMYEFTDFEKYQR